MMMMTEEGRKHASSFELDVYFASQPAEREVAVEEHVAGCPRCRAYLEALDRVLAAMPAEAQRERTEKPRPWRSMRWKQQRRLASVLGVLAVAASAVVYFGARRDKSEDGYVGVKGAPGAQILLRRDGQVRVWDGVSPVRAGDAIAVDVACEQFNHVTVAAEQASGTVTRAWEGDCPTKKPSPLPFTLVVDEQPGREHFSVVLHRAHHLDDEQLRSALRGSVRTGDVWTIDFAFAKEDR